jgi:integrase
LFTTRLALNEGINERTGNCIDRVCMVVQRYHALAEQGDLIERSPVRSKLYKPEFSREEKPSLSSLEVRMLLEQVEPENRLFLLLIAVTGMRLSEALGLRWQDFEASAGTCQSLTGCGERVWDRQRPKRVAQKFNSLKSWSRR